MNIAILRSISLFSTGLPAGAFFYATLNVLPTFSAVPTHVHLVFRTTLMQHNGISMPILMAMAILSSFTYAIFIYRRDRRASILTFVATLLAVGTLLTTLYGNVPINGIIKQWVPDAPPADWQVLLRQWDFFHIIRTTTAIGSFACMILSWR